MIEGGGESLQTPEPSAVGQDVRAMIEEIRKQICESLGLSADLLGPAPPIDIAHSTFKHYVEEMMRKTVPLFDMGDCGIIDHFTLSWERRAGRRVIATYYSETGAELGVGKFRSLRTANVLSRRVVGDMVINYWAKPSVPIERVQINGTVERWVPPAGIVREMNLSDYTVKALEAIAESESAKSWPPKIPTPIFPNRPGTLAYWSNMGVLSGWDIRNPSDPFYSMSLMLATHRWDITGPCQGKWVPIDPVTDEHDQGDTNAAE